jgi:hypothetical protein
MRTDGPERPGLNCAQKERPFVRAAEGGDLSRGRALPGRLLGG